MAGFQCSSHDDENFSLRDNLNGFCLDFEFKIAFVFLNRHLDHIP